MRKIKKLMGQALLLTINSLSEDIRSSGDLEKNKRRAEAIKTLAEAFEKVNG